MGVTTLGLSLEGQADKSWLPPTLLCPGGAVQCQAGAVWPRNRVAKHKTCGPQDSERQVPPELIDHVIIPPATRSSTFDAVEFIKGLPGGIGSGVRINYKHM